MLNIGNKTFMNLQEAVGWLLENNALPFQSTANYVANTEIAMSTLVNPSPAKVRVGSLIFFADSKVSTVVGVTSNSFIVSDQYNDLVDDVVYVSNVALNASGHLIVTLSNGDNIDAGLIKQVSGFSIDASQHLIVTYNDGSTTDLGAIFNGNVNISGTLNATNITGDSIIETMTGYSFVKNNVLPGEYIYAGIVKNGNKLTFVAFVKLNFTALPSGNHMSIGNFVVPNAVSNKIYPYTIGGLSNVVLDKQLSAFSGINIVKEINGVLYKGGTSYDAHLYGLSVLDLNTDYLVRFECTLLLSDNLAA